MVGSVGELGGRHYCPPNRRSIIQQAFELVCSSPTPGLPRDDLKELTRLEQGTALAILTMTMVLLLAPQDTPEGWVSHAVVLAPDLETVVFGRFHNEEGVSQLVIHSGQGEARAGTAVKHRGIMRAADFSPDGKWLAAGDYGGITSIWDTKTWERVAEPKLQESWTTGIAFSPDGKTIATVGRDGTVVLVDWKSNEELWRKETDGVATTTKFTPDGKALAVSFSNSRVEFLNVRNGDSLSSFVSDTSFPMCMAFSCDGKHLILGCWDSSIEIWDLERSELIASKKVHTKRVRSIAVAPNGLHFATAADDASIILWELSTGSIMHKWKPKGRLVGDVRFSKEGDALFGAAFDGSLRRFDLPE